MARVILPALAVLALLAAPASAARLETGSSFTLTEEETQAGDLYFGGTALRLDGTVEGSVVAGAQSITITGPVTSNLIAGAQNINISAPVRGDIIAGCASIVISDTVYGAVRVGSGTVHIEGDVGRDVIAGCRDLTVTGESEVSGDVVAGCATLNIAGVVRGNVKVAAGEIVVSGIIDRDLVARVEDRLVLTQDARIFGNLRYESDEELDIGNPDAVFGTISWTKSVHDADFDELKELRPRPGLITAFLLPFAILSILGALAVGFILIAIWKQAIVHALDRAIERFGRTVGFGALGLFAAPLALLVALLLIVTIPASFIGTLLYIVSLYLAKMLAGMFVGKWLFRIFGGRTASIWLTAPVGIILVYALCALPVIGWLIWLFCAMIGFGVIAELIGQSRRP